MCVSTMPQYLTISDADKPRILEKVLFMSRRGSRTGAFEYLELCQKALHPDDHAIQIGVRALEHLVSG